MKIEIALTSSESKCLIAKAVLKMETVSNALKNGTLVICRGSTNAFIIEELTGSAVEKGNYTAGYVGPKGLSVNPHVPTETIFVEDKIKKGAALADIMNELKPGDVIIKGANAIGPDGIPAVLIGRGNPKTNAGTLGLFQMPAMARGINVIVPVGLEKSIPVSVLVGSKEVAADKIDWATGMPCSLIPIFGTVVTEVEALKILAEVEAIPIAAGGIGGAEGSTVLLVKGAEEHVQKAINIIEKIKGEPQVKEPK
jgi:hypothetical protein